ncbi:MAG: M48 family metalloprotease [Pseudomonadota bacterium]
MSTLAHPFVSRPRSAATARRPSLRLAISVALCALALAGCVTNPVTGRSELALITPAQEIRIGEQNYVPAQQSQGGQLASDPELTAYVNEVGQRMARTSGVELPYEFVVLNNSVPNAWAMPGGKIAINRGLLTELDNEAELAAVLGHEVTHSAARHGAKAMQRGIFLQGALVTTAVISQRKTEYANALVGAAQVAAGLISTKYGRDAERESDLYGTRWLADAGYDPMAAVTLQETFVRLSKGRPTDWLSGLFASHPPSAERVENNRRQVEELRAQGLIRPDAELGGERYQAALARTRARLPAYKAQDEARKALADKDVDGAVAAITRALRAAPGEASFHGTRGDIRYQQQRWDDAVTNYTRAIERDDAYYHYYLGRGMATLKRSGRDAARSDLERSVRLLPTATATNELGKIAEAAGNRDLALRYYESAAGSQSAAGAEARGRFLVLDLARRPGEYVKTQVRLTEQGAPVLLIANATDMALRDVVVDVELTWESGQVDRLQRGLRALSARGQMSVRLPQREMRLARQASRVVRAAPAGR